MRARGINGNKVYDTPGAKLEHLAEVFRLLDLSDGQTVDLLRAEWGGEAMEKRDTAKHHAQDIEYRGQTVPTLTSLADSICRLMHTRARSFLRWTFSAAAWAEFSWVLQVKRFDNLCMTGRIIAGLQCACFFQHGA